MSYPSLSSKQFIKALKKDGWIEDEKEGSHLGFKHPTKPGKVTVQHPVKDILIKNLSSMLRQSNLTKKQLLKLLK